MKGKTREEKLNNKGITLIALVITIIVLVILAGISVNVLIGERGVIKQAQLAKEKQKIAEVTENLELYKVPVSIENSNVIKIEDYIIYVKKNSKYDIDNVTAENEIQTYITVDGKYEYLLTEQENGNLLIEYQGKAEELLPRIQDIKTDNTTSSIKVEIDSLRAEQYKYYIKTKDSQEYVLKEENDNIGKYIYEGLTPDMTYIIKVEVINKIGTVIQELEITTDEKVELLETELLIEMNPNTWTSQDVVTKATINTDKDVSNYTLQYTKSFQNDLTVEELKQLEWNNYGELGIISNENETIYFRLLDKTDSTSYISKEITFIDKEEPVSTVTLTGDKTQKSAPVKVNANIVNTDDGSGVNFEKSKWVYNAQQDEIGLDESEYTGGKFTSSEQTITLSTSSAGTYYLHILTVDNVGHKIETIKGPIEIVANKHAHTSGCYTTINDVYASQQHCYNCGKTWGINGSPPGGYCKNTNVGTWYTCRICGKSGITGGSCPHGQKLTCTKTIDSYSVTY